MFLIWFNVMIIYLFIDSQVRIGMMRAIVSAKTVHQSTEKTSDRMKYKQVLRTGTVIQNMEVTDVQEENKMLLQQKTDLTRKLADLEASNALLEKQYSDALGELDLKIAEISKLRDDISNLRKEMEAKLIQLQILMDENLSLNLEISMYRDLLESNENWDGFNSS